MIQPISTHIPALSSTGENRAGGEGGGTFLDSLQGAMNQVQNLQTEARHQVDNLLSGQGEDVHSAMVAVEKADLSFQLMMQVRNKIVAAYEEVSKMAF